MEGRLNAVEGRMETLEISMGGIESAVQELVRVIGERGRRDERHLDGSQGSVNGRRTDEDEREGDGVGGGHREEPPYWKKRVELPVFEGSEPMNWIYRADKFFELQGVPEDEKLRLAYISMEGMAGHWFRFWREKARNRSWVGLKEALVVRFGGRNRGTVFERLASCKQSGSVGDYIQEFEVLVSQAEKIPEAQLLGYFMAGLQEGIRNQLRLLDPKEFMDVMRLARDVEAFQAGARASGGNSSKGPTWGKPSGSVARVDPGRHNQNRTGTVEKEGGPRREGERTFVNTQGRNIRDLPYAEYVKRREEGRCFRCGGPFGPGHRCPERGLRMLILAEDEEPGGEEEVEVELEQMELSAFSAGGLTQPRTMKLHGQIGTKQVLILIDSGASHNFISRELVEGLALPVVDTPPYRVSLGDGQRKETRGCCEAVTIHMGEVVINERFHLFELGGVDVILGVEWLAKLGEVTLNWGQLTMAYVQAGRRMTIKGDPTLTRRLVEPAALLKMKEVEIWLLMWELGETEKEEEQRPNAQEQETFGPELTRKQTFDMTRILERYANVFHEPNGLPPDRGLVHQIPLKEGTDPVNVRPYRYPHVMEGEIEKQVAEMLQAGVIRSSNSPYSSPVILVKKKDGSWRFCVDYRALNRATIPDKFPIPLIEELLDELRGAKYFSKVDLKSGYHQIRMGAGDIEKTAFRTHQGHYEFMVMPFGLTNAPATFQSAMNKLLQPYLRKFVLVFFDDILVYSRTWEEHLEHVGTVLRELVANGWVANRKKCEFGRTQIGYLGHRISEKGVEMDEDKVRAVMEWDKPKTVKALRGFLGLTGYYRRFVKDYGKIARPLTDLLKKGQFAWTEQAEESMLRLKQAITTAPVLILPDFDQPFHIECDTSGRGIGAVLMQGKQPIAFFSKALSEGSLGKSIYEKELMALVLAIQHWRPYLLGQRFVVHTDQRSLKYLLEQRITTQNQQDWLAKLLGYDFEIVYKSGVTNKVADALSRKNEDELQEEKELSVIARPYWQDFREILEEVEADEELRKVIDDLKRDPNSHPSFTLENERLHYKGRLVLSARSAWVPKLIAEFHTTQTGGHSGVYRTYRKVAQSLYWVGMKKAVTEFVASCLVCQQHKYLTSSPQGLLQPLPIPNAIWEEISMDFIVKLPKSRGYDAVLVVVDRLSKYGHFIPLKHPYSARTIAEVFVKEIVRLHGVPLSIVSDRDPLFLSNFWKELFKLQGTHLKMSTAYHPESDGQTEVVNRVLEGYLRCFCSEQPKGWCIVLPWAEYWYNTSYQESAKCTPFETVYGRPPPSLHRFVPGETLVEAVNQELQTRDEALHQLKFHLARAQELMVRQADKARRPSQVGVGDWVYLKIRPHRQTTMSSTVHSKLAARYFGPFLVIQQVGAVAFKLQLPESARIHPVFHASQLKKAVGDHRIEQELPTDLEMEEPSPRPVRVLDKRQVQQGEDERQEVLIEWQEGGPDGATWEDALTIRDQYPDFNLEDKVDLQEVGNVRAWRVYERRRYRRERGEDERPEQGGNRTVADERGELEMTRGEDERPQRGEDERAGPGLGKPSCRKS
ncbi:hypothetical protein LR48_Vigan08g059400 [Vigna angularis]|uniref:Reverse transcriptase n=1 Tax=Phaseolus angularis TaxID=3914 RepID=A0A0L9V4A1_PHAAN|nr:hypothetical protein LR48_Vigan08g059400 [Vigna angularis]